MASKIEGKKWLEQAEASGQLYRIKSGWKGMMIFAGILTCLLVITIPFGIWFIITANKARVGITEEGFAIRWFTTTAFRWDEIEAFQPIGLHFHVQGGGLVGALVGVAASSAVAARTEGLKGPLGFKLKGKKMFRQMPAHAIERSVAMAQQMEKYTGLTIFPKTEEAAKGEAAEKPAAG